jgi:hypothetical protein
VKYSHHTSLPGWKTATDSVHPSINNQPKTLNLAARPVFYPLLGYFEPNIFSRTPSSPGDSDESNQIQGNPTKSDQIKPCACSEAWPITNHHHPHRIHMNPAKSTYDLILSAMGGCTIHNRSRATPRAISQNAACIDHYPFDPGRGI